MRKRLLLLSAYDAPSHALLATSTEEPARRIRVDGALSPRDTLTGESAAMLCSGHRQKPPV